MAVEIFGLRNFLNNKVIKAASWYTITNFFMKGIIFLTIPIFTRMLSPDDYGIVSVYTAWVGVFTILISLDLKVCVGTGKIDFKYKYSEFISSITFLSIILFLFSLFIVILFNNFFLKFTNLSKILFFLMFIQAYFSFIQSLAIAKFSFEYKYKVISILNIITSILGVILSIFLINNVFQKQKYLGRILGSGSLIIILGLFFLSYLLFKGRVLINSKYWKYALALSVPLVLHNLSYIINSQFDRIMINRYLGNLPTGIYSFAYNVGMIILVVLNSFEQAWVPWFYEKMELKNYEVIKRGANSYRNSFVFLYAVILLISPELVKLMADKSYWEGLYIIPWIFMAYYFQFMYAFEVNVEKYYKKTGLLSLGTILSAIINILLNIIFIPLYGYTAAAITTVVSYFFLFVFHYILTSKVIKHRVYGMKFHLQSLLYIFILTIYFIVFQYAFWFRIIGIGILIGVFCRLIKKFIIKVI